MRLRTQIFLALAGLVVVLFGAVLWWAETALAEDVRAFARAELEREARAVGAILGDRAFSDAAADSLGALIGHRVTLIAPDGTVLGDSEVPARRLSRVENHAGRAEVRAALEGRVGSARRASETVNRAFLYVAVPHPGGVIRLARAASEVEATVVRAERIALAGAAASLLVAFLVAGVTSRLVARPLERVEDAVREIGGGDLSRRLRPEGKGELAGLVRTVNEMASGLEKLVDDLRGEKDDLEALFESLDDGLAVLAPDGTVLEANRAFRSMVGREDVIGRRFTTLVRSPELVEAAHGGLEGEVESREAQIGDRTIFASVQPHHEGALVVLRDLTRLRRLEGVRRDFVANVSHELKTPLTSLIGFAEAMEGDELTEEQRRKFAERVLANARRMRQLVDDLLDLARIESGHWEPSAEVLDLEAAARRAWAGLEEAVERRGVGLAVELVEGTEEVEADPDALRQILRNLFDNALRYAPEGTDVALRARREEDRVRVEVRDEGPGVSRAHRGRIFERFYRVDPARSREAGGTGLGLSIVKNLVTAHGGDVGIESEVGLGATLWFTLRAPHTRRGSGHGAAGSRIGAPSPETGPA